MGLGILHFLVILNLSLASQLNSTARLQPVSSDCENVQRVFRNMIYSTDQCIFISMEHIDCPLSFPTQATFTISLEQIFSGLVHEHQHTHHCEIVIVFLKDFALFRQFINNKSLNNIFQPFTRIGIFALELRTFEGVLDSIEIQREILSNALSISLGRVYNSTHNQFYDAFTKETIIFSQVQELKEYVEVRNHYLAHPLFKSNSTSIEFKISLFECPPHVIRLAEGMTLDRWVNIIKIKSKNISHT